MSGSKGQEIVYTWVRLNTPTHKELSDTIDAALRRAKAEGERFGLQQGLLIAHIIETGTAAQVIDGINARIAELDARAAQIEADYE